MDGTPSIYELLKWYGFSPAKAREIELDNTRNDETAVRTVKHIQQVWNDTPENERE